MLWHRSPLLRAYLVFLALVEAVSLLRLAAGADASAVCPCFSSRQPASTSLLFGALAAVLLCVRATSAAHAESVAAWTSTAAVHAVEALFLSAAAFGAGEAAAPALPRALAAWRPRHAPAALFVAAVCANAGLFAAAAMSAHAEMRGFLSDRAARAARRARAAARDAAGVLEEAAKAGREVKCD